MNLQLELLFHLEHPNCLELSHYYCVIGEAKLLLFLLGMPLLLAIFEHYCSCWQLLLSQILLSS
jgi:hypothetical protein